MQIQAVAVGWQIYDLTHSAMQLGLVGLAQFLPMVLLTLPAGHAADAFERARLSGGAMLAQGVLLALLAGGTAGGWLGVPGIFGLLVVIGSARAFERPATHAMAPTLVPESEVPTAMAWNAAAFETASVAGPALGGLLYTLGPTVPYAVAAALALAGSALMVTVRKPGAPGGGGRNEPGRFLAGLHFIRSRPVILGSISLDLFAVLLGGATALLPVFARDILGIGSTGLGLLRAAPSIGSLLMSAWLLRHPVRRRVGRSMFASVVGFGLATIVFGFSRSVTLSFLALVALGAADTISVVIRATVVQLGTPDPMRGRVSAVNSLFVGTSNQLGEFESGFTAALLGTVPATVLGGVATIGVAFLWMRLFPALASCDSPGDAVQGTGGGGC
jgi:Transmembrane secretion effector